MGHGQIRRRRKLSVGFAALDQLDRQAGPFGHGRIVGQVRVARCGGSLVCGQYFGEAKALRRLRPPQVRALDGGCDLLRRARALQTVGERDRSDGALTVSKRRQHTIDDIGGDERPGGVVDQNAIGRMGLERLQSVQHGALPGRPAGDRREQLGIAHADGAVIERADASADDDLNQADARMAEKHIQAGPEDRRGAERGVLLGRGCAGACALSGGDDQRGGLQRVLTRARSF